MRALAVAVTFLAVTIAGADDAAAPAVDRSSPDAVVHAYLAACEKGDATAAMALVKEDKPLDLMLQQMGLRAELMGWLRDILLLPINQMTASQIGQPAAANDQVTVKIDRTLTAKQTLVLVKRADGGWEIDLRASLKTSAGEQKSMFLTQLEMMERQPEQQGVAAAMDPSAWQCQSQLRELSSALQAYAEEHGGKLPTAAVWMDELEPYLDNKQPFACPGHDKEEYGYAFNQELDGATLPQDWQQRHWITLLACVEGSVPNGTFKPADLKALKPRHGDVNVATDGDGNPRFLPAGMGPLEVQRTVEETNHCQERLRALVDAAKKFAGEHGGKLPGATAWCDDLRPYLANFDPADGGDVFACPGCPGAKCTYAINADLAGKELGKLINQRKLVLFFETEPRELNTVATPGAKVPGRHLNEWNSQQPQFLHRACLNGTVSQGF